MVIEYYIWEPNIAPICVGDGKKKNRQFLRAYKDGFSFSLKDLGSLKGLEIQIEFTNDTHVF